MVEQNYSLSLQYKTEVLEFNVLEESYYGFLELYNKDYVCISENFPEECKFENQYPSYFTIKKISDNWDKKIDELIDFIQKSTLETIKNVELLNSKIKILEKYYKEKDEKKLECLIKILNKIVIAKKIDEYRFSKIDIEEQKYLLGDIIKKWTYLRTIFSKLLFSKRYIDEHFSNIDKTINEIIKLEYKYYKNLLNINWEELYNGNE